MRAIALAGLLSIFALSACSSKSSAPAEMAACCKTSADMKAQMPKCCVDEKTSECCKKTQMGTPQDCCKKAQEITAKMPDCCKKNAAGTPQDCCKK